MIREVEEALIGHLAAANPQLTVEGFPDDPRAYVPRSQHGTLLVSYSGRRWSDIDGGEPRHVREIRYDITVVQRNLKKKGAHLGVEELLDLVASQMEGLEAEGFVFYPERDDFIDELDGVWFYALKVVGLRRLKLEVPA